MSWKLPLAALACLSLAAFGVPALNRYLVPEKAAPQEVAPLAAVEPQQVGVGSPPYFLMAVQLWDGQPYPSTKPGHPGVPNCPLYGDVYDYATLKQQGFQRVTDAGQLVYIVQGPYPDLGSATAALPQFRKNIKDPRP